ncbi:MAG: hypothetical protein ABSE73_16370 [Planctomycetota bacterium]
MAANEQPRPQQRHWHRILRALWILIRTWLLAVPCLMALLAAACWPPGLQPLRRFEGHAKGIADIQFSPHDDCLLTASADGTVRVWDVDSGNTQATIPHPAAVNAAAFSPDGKRIVTGSDNGDVYVFETLSGARQLILPKHNTAVKSVAFSPDGSLVASAGDDGTIRICDANTGQRRTTIEHCSSCNVRFSPDGAQILTTLNHGHASAELWDVNTGQHTRLVDPGASAAFFSSDGRRILAFHHGPVIVWDAATGAKLGTLPNNYLAFSSYVAVSPDWHFALHYDGDNIFGDPYDHWLCDVQRGGLEAELDGAESYSSCGAFSSDGRYAVAGCVSGAAVMWDLAGLATPIRRSAWRIGFCLALVASLVVCLRRAVGDLFSLFLARQPSRRRFSLMTLVFGVLLLGAGVGLWLHIGYWSAVAWLPEFWLTAFFTVAFVWSVCQDRKTL